MTVEEMISDQDKFAQQVRDRCTSEMESFGLVIDSFQIQAITSPATTSKTWPCRTRPKSSRTPASPAPGRPGRGRQEQTAQAQIANRSGARDQEGRFQAEIDRAQKVAGQQGPLAEAQSRQAVVEQETRVAELQAQQKEQQLQVDVASRPTPRPTARSLWPRQGATSASPGGSRRSEVRLAAEAQAAAVKVRPRPRPTPRVSTARPTATRSRPAVSPKPRRSGSNPARRRHREPRRGPEPEPGSGHRPADRPDHAGHRSRGGVASSTSASSRSSTALRRDERPSGDHPVGRGTHRRGPPDAGSALLAPGAGQRRRWLEGSPRPSRPGARAAAPARRSRPRLRPRGRARLRFGRQAAGSAK